ncbi:hypothetical protein NYR76_03205 [Actinobacillus equuli subsp. equuli]|uniref:hypothetical protein n=1 Tax=Actinobacillus equuli TaxID=718 RepID=UPI0024433171|nr:hypothetical protein [Actinobacillus equuli]WGE65983.1 hypothetical protein NYR76_03205 [Actinobacillus equuli subsp. equuli]
MKQPTRLFYSLNRAIEYLNKDLGYSTFKAEDLIHFIKKEKLETIFQMEGIILKDSASITAICENELPQPLQINNLTIQYTKSEYTKNEPVGLLKSYTQEFKNDCLTLIFQHFDRNNRKQQTQPYARLLPCPSDAEFISLDCLDYITFKGYFKIDNSQYRGNDVEIVKRGYIEINPLYLFQTPLPEPIRETTTLFFFIKSLETPLKLDFDSIEISHNDLERFIDSQEKNDISELQNEIKHLKTELAEKQKIIDSLSLTEARGRISSPQKQLFALLVKKCYPDLDSRNKVFEVINADLKEAGIRNTAIKADTFYKLIDETADYTKMIFPPKKS